jgi:pilus assembly protein CpaB
MLVGVPLGSEHSLLIPPGMVAVPVPVNRFSSVAYGISPGDKVNVIVTINFVDLDTQFQSILPNFTAGVLTPGSNFLLEGGSLVFQDRFFNFTATIVAGGSIAGRAEVDAALDQPFYYIPSELQRPRVVSQTVLQNVMVLHVGNFPLPGEDTFSPDVVEAPEAPPAEGEEAAPVGPEPPDIVTLIVWPQDAVTINYLIYTGAQITLVLRNVGDSSQTLTDAVTLQYLMEVYRIPVPAKLPYGTNPPIDLLVPPVLENDKEDDTTGE